MPSSNTAVEPLIQAIISSIKLTDTIITVHFSRFSVTEISQSQAALSQFKLKPILAAAQLLADAKVDVIGWSGTAAGWTGFEKDEIMCRAIREATGIPATSSTLALNALLKRFDIKKLGLVTPYLAAMNEAIIANYAGIGVEITGERHLDMTSNVAIGDVSESQLDDMVYAVAASGVRAVTTFCTNLHAAHLVSKWESQYYDQSLVVFDTISTVVWAMLDVVSVEPSNVKGWGKMFNATRSPPE